MHKSTTAAAAAVDYGMAECIHQHGAIDIISSLVSLPAPDQETTT
jgi:hypothetical protein